MKSESRRRSGENPPHKTSPWQSWKNVSVSKVFGNCWAIGFPPLFNLSQGDGKGARGWFVSTVERRRVTRRLIRSWCLCCVALHNQLPPRLNERALISQKKIVCSGTYICLISHHTHVVHWNVLAQFAHMPRAIQWENKGAWPGRRTDPPGGRFPCQRQTALQPNTTD